MKQLILGTVQLGMNYGINNKDGKPTADEAFNILSTAYENGIHVLDTASAYGDSEKIIGEFIKKNKNSFKIVTKLKKLDKNKDELNQVKQCLKDSLNNLEVSKIDYYLYHSFEDLKNNKNVFQYLSGLKQKGYIEKLGVSIYDIEELEYVLSNFSEDIDMIQIPFNIFDLRWIKSDLFKQIKNKNIEIAARSIFLQGLFFADKNAADKIHPKAYEYITKLKEFSKFKKVSIQQLTMSFVKQQEFIDFLLIGCENINQLLTNVRNFNIDIEFSQNDMDFINENFGSIDKKIIDPRQW